jgi:membrane fusion protein (multidrug efflux system)
MTKKKKLVGIFGAIAIIGSLYFLAHYILYVETDNAQVAAHVVFLTPKVGGYVTQVNVTEGQKVAKGDILVKIDDRDYQNALKQSQSDLSALEARNQDAERNFRRLSQLYKQGAVSQQQFDTSSANYQEVKSKYEAVNAQVSQAQLNIENTEIKAPFDGIVAKKSVEPGQLASPGIPLIGFVDSFERWIIANFKETEIKNVTVGEKAFIEIDAIKNKKFVGIVDSLSPATGATFTLLPPDNATGNFVKVVQRVPVKIRFENLTEEELLSLRAGLSSLVKVHRF